MTGGEGSILGTLLGAMLLGVIRNALVLLKVTCTGRQLWQDPSLYWYVQ